MMGYLIVLNLNMATEKQAANKKNLKNKHIFRLNFLAQILKNYQIILLNVENDILKNLHEF